MNNRKTALFFAITIIGVLVVSYITMRAGSLLLPPGWASKFSFTASENELKDTVIHSMRHAVAVFILQLIVIIITSQACAYLFKKAGQPAVMGEIIAGIALGPSLIGALWPAFTAFVFPAASLGNLQMLSQVGLILFMFVVGLELDPGIIRQKMRTAFIISHASIVLPFSLGMALSLFLYRQYAPPNTPFYAFSLFIGIAMSITAFPVLARIIRERGLTGTRLGTIALTAAAAGDVTAWCALAFIIAVVRAGSVSASLFTLISAVLYILLMLLVVRPLLRRFTKKNDHAATFSRATLAIIFVALLLSAYCCEVIGIHALFGAFLAGIVMPRDERFRQMITDKIEDVALVLLLPLFFVLTGLRTQVGLLNDSASWLVCLIIILVAMTGKFGGSAIAARMTGESKQDSLMIGALMNTRGLVELVVLNIGYDLGILTPRIFTMLVIMALVTTFMTSPAINLINRLRKDA